MMPQFDPYDALIQLDLRLTQLEIAHNRMADAFHKSEQELNIALHSVQNLQVLNARLQNRIKTLEASLERHK